MTMNRREGYKTAKNMPASHVESTLCLLLVYQYNVKTVALKGNTFLVLFDGGARLCCILCCQPRRREAILRNVDISPGILMLWRN